MSYPVFLKMFCPLIRYIVWNKWFFLNLQTTFSLMESCFIECSEKGSFEEHLSVHMILESTDISVQTWWWHNSNNFNYINDTNTSNVSKKCEYAFLRFAKKRKKWQETANYFHTTLTTSFVLAGTYGYAFLFRRGCSSSVREASKTSFYTNETEVQMREAR